MLLLHPYPWTPALPLDGFTMRTDAVMRVGGKAGRANLASGADLVCNMEN